VVASAVDRDGKRRLWLAAIDRQSPPHQIANIEGDMPLFGNGDEIFFRRVEGAAAYIYRVLKDGSGLRRISDQAVAGSNGVSPDGQWVLVKAPGQTGSPVLALPVTGGDPMRILGPAITDHRLAWSSDRRLLFIVAPGPSSLMGRTYVVPLASGRIFPQIPEGGFQRDSDLSKLPGARVLEVADIAPGPTPGEYTFSRSSVQRNLYRIPLR
jgi:hypothetical protein